MHSRFSIVALPLALASILFLGGCIVSRVDPQKPELPLPAALPEQGEQAAQLPDPWWTIFRDPTLDRLVDEAIAHNPDIAVAAGRVAEARAGLRIVNADRVPNLDIEGDATRSKSSALVNTFPGVDRYQTTYTVQGAVGFELDLWGRYQRASESARAQLLNTEFGREATKLSLTGEVARGYFGLIAAAQQLARARDTLSTRNESLGLEKIRFDAGEIDEFTFKRAAADAAATRVSVHQLEREVVERTNALGSDVTRGAAFDSVRAPPRHWGIRSVAGIGRRRHWRRPCRDVPAHQPHRTVRLAQHRARRLVHQASGNVDCI